ncbi:pentapeptide repeat-containing protein [Nonomuraea zeae]|uniref:Pentapeptide repeat-containing protein n=1 Tax=Nonomuraea zeae TaxID=1642303 RepID=A0A5S4FAJ3_9ACTN|nr:pentapeptide repeat-containing protein [Nonomuraea zeae]TMR14388.1 pentapeptide repeat-containing protein [Nonomuraea zeae]
MMWRRSSTGQPTAPLTRAEFDALPAKDRAELHNSATESRRQLITTLVQIATTLGVLISLLLTAQGLAQTAQSIDAAREEQRVAREGLAVTRKGQISDRFGRAVEQLASKSLDVRVAGMFALEGVAREETSYREATTDLLATYVVGNGRKGASLQPRDIQGALAVLGRTRPADPKTGWLQLARAQIPGARLRGLYLARSNLMQADLSRALIHESDLSGADLRAAGLKDAFLIGSSFADANFNLADLSKATLTSADLSRANLYAADLTGASFYDVQLAGAELGYAKLSGATGLPPVAKLKKIVKWNSHTVWP